METDAKKRKEKLEEYIRQNPNSSTIEQEQLKEIEEQERKERDKPGEVQY
ncbi:MAG TPA: hypothetical protein VFD30_05865 [Terriglobia bacterium]|jgi:hypothetical protein|nr:hypothetical protein [Terriglobia bacterium]